MNNERFLAFLLILGKIYLVFSDKNRNFAVVIEIERHIEILLLDNDCVIVPGLGGFTAHHVEARYDDADGVFVPPLRTLGFNPQLKINDSLLVQSYIEAYDICYPEALRRVESEVEELWQHLNNDGSYEMNDIGILEINEEGNIEFTPCEAGILTPNLYGLSSFEMSPLAVEPQESLTQETNATRAGSPTPITTTVFDTPKVEKKEETFYKETDEDEERTICIKVSLLRNVGIAAAAVIALLLVFTPISHTGLKNVAMGDFNGTSFFSKLMPKDSQMNKIDITAAKVSVKDTVIKHVAPKLKADTAKVSTPKAKEDTFCIVVASSIPQKNADRYVEQLHKRGLTQAYTYVSNHMVRVIYGNYASENDAYNALQKVRGNAEFENAWILKKKTTE